MAPSVMNHKLCTPIMSQYCSEVSKLSEQILAGQKHYRKVRFCFVIHILSFIYLFIYLLTYLFTYLFIYLFIN